jgi:hypothetical protein
MVRKGGGDESEPKSGGSGLPSLRFYHSKSLRTKTLSVLDALETAEDATRHRDALAEVVRELTEAGIAYYFVKPVQVAKVGFMSERSIKLGVAGILRIMGPIVRRVIGGMNAHQLRSVSRHIRHLMT